MGYVTVVEPVPSRLATEVPPNWCYYKCAALPSWAPARRSPDVK